MGDVRGVFAALRPAIQLPYGRSGEHWKRNGFCFYISSPRTRYFHTSLTDLYGSHGKGENTFTF